MSARSHNEPGAESRSPDSQSDLVATQSTFPPVVPRPGSHSLGEPWEVIWHNPCSWAALPYPAPPRKECSKCLTG